ncbi:hypothetical protein FIBSPDRAFT_965368 [Athelia psychrophila]|uniref:Uncharacterized protein n=1 Tax=Athelia psychrophila TaxID=1759441 RepID=A0A165WQ20_9AGAM|nr:hypothetical protein FIBSPDRAFT_965368 [Fibularhizoctonia sp. CBS 109695]
MKTILLHDPRPSPHPLLCVLSHAQSELDGVMDDILRCVLEGSDEKEMEVLKHFLEEPAHFLSPACARSSRTHLGERVVQGVDDALRDPSSDLSNALEVQSLESTPIDFPSKLGKPATIHLPQARVDDTSPLAHYAGNWFGDVDPTNNQGYNHTQHLTRVIGSSATFILMVRQSTQVTVLGSYAGSPGPTSEYSIDDGPPILFTGSVNSTVELYDRVFYKSVLLADGEHTITLKLVAGDWFWFDEFMYVPSSASSSTSTSKPKTVIGAIVGGVIARLIAVVTLVFLRLFWRKRRREHHMYGSAAN